MLLFFTIFLSACHHPNREKVDKLNSLSYYYHYKNLDSTAFYANQALKAANDYPAGKAEALNNLAFVNIMKMNYQDAYIQTDSVRQITDNQIEQLVAEVQMMRLCQRESRNKEFYDHHERALKALRRIDEERDMIPERTLNRLNYAESEFHIVTSTYFYYVGLEKESVEALYKTDVDAIEQDTAQYLNYLYQIGAGGILSGGTPEDIARKEWDTPSRGLASTCLSKRYATACSTTTMPARHSSIPTACLIHSLRAIWPNVPYNFSNNMAMSIR